MNIYSFPETFTFKKPVVTVGTFDGVHNGHREVIRHLKTIAEEINGETVLVTLWPHPRIALDKTDNNFSLLNTRDEKSQLLAELGIHNLIIIPFTKEFSEMSSADFIKRVLVEALHISHLVVGSDNHFGHNREGNYQSVNQYASYYGFTVVQPEMILVNAAKISSTEIRKLILEGDMEAAAGLLGYQYMLSGTVIKGDGIGQTLGFPTANLKLDDDFKMIPPDGVYAVKVINNSKEYGGMMYIGNRPTLKNIEKKKNIEIHLFNFTGDLYDQRIMVRIFSRVREDKKFKGLDDLRQQISKDKDTILKLLETKNE